MKRYQFFCLAALTIAVLLTGCGRKLAEPVANAGIVDYAKLFLNHPLASEAHELEARMQFIEKKAKGFSVALLPSGINSNQAEGQMLEVFFRQEMAAKVLEAQNLVDSRKKQAELALRDYVDNELSKREGTDTAKAMELTTELTALKMTAQKKDELKKQIDSLFEEYDAQKNMLFNAKKRAAEKDVSEYIFKIRSDLNVFAADLRENIRVRNSEMTGFAVASFDEQPIAELKNDPQKQVEIMRKRMDEIKRKVDSDIRSAVARVAKARNLQIVIGTPLVNLRCVDITEDVRNIIVHGN